MQELAAKGCLALERAAEIGAPEEKTLLPADIAKGSRTDGGDLWFLVEHSDETKARIDAAHKRFQQRWLEREAGLVVRNTSVPSPVALAWKAARDAWRN